MVSTRNNLNWHIPEFSTEQGATGLFVFHVCGASRSFMVPSITPSNIEKNLGDKQVERRAHEDSGYYC